MAARANPVEVVAADPALDLGEARGDRVGLALGERAQVLDQLQIARAAGDALQVTRHLGELDRLAVGHQRVDREQVVDHDAVAQRARAAGVVGGHAAERRPRAGRDVDREEQAVRLEKRFRRSSTTPGSTQTVRACGSSSSTRSRCLE